MTEKLRLGVLISGRGSNLQALLDASRSEDYPARVAFVVSNVADAPGLARARSEGVETMVIDHRVYPARELFDKAVDRALKERGIGLVCLAGFMRRLSPGFVESWSGRMINIHPSLLPSFKGLSPHRQALEAGVRLHGCSVHFVSTEVDAGPIIAQAAVPVLDGDDEERLAARVLEVEHRIYPLVVRLIGEGRVSLAGRHVRVVPANGELPPALINPGA